MNTIVRIIKQRTRLLGVTAGAREGAQPVVLSPDELAHWKETQGGDV